MAMKLYFAYIAHNEIARIIYIKKEITKVERMRKTQIGEQKDENRYIL